MTDQEIVDVVRAHMEGKKIEAKTSHCVGPWLSQEYPAWDFCRVDYRVAKEPMRVWLIDDPDDKRIYKRMVETGKFNEGAREFVEVLPS